MTDDAVMSPLEKIRQDMTAQLAAAKGHLNGIDEQIAVYQKRRGPAAELVTALEAGLAGLTGTKPAAPKTRKSTGPRAAPGAVERAIVEKTPLHTVTDIAELIQKTGMKENSLRGAMGKLVKAGVFVEDKKGAFRHRGAQAVMADLAGIDPQPAAPATMEAAQ